MRRLLLLAAFFVSAPSVLVLSILFLVFLSYQQKTGLLGFSPHQNKAIAYAALPSNINVVGDTIGQEDMRIGRVSSFLEGFNSPLAQYSVFIVNTADKYNVDYRLLPAIGAQESGDCTKGKSTSWKNCWGYGIYGKRVIQFESYEDAIDTITRYFANKKNNGIDTLDELGSIYNPTDHNNWKANVASFMTQL